MSLTTIEAMNQAIALAGGRMTEEQYLESVKDLIVASGRETTVKSLKSNAFSANRMDKAGVCRVSIGDDRQVWSKAQADVLLAGGAPMVNAVVSPTPTPSIPVGVIPADDTPVATVQIGGSFYGVPRNSPEVVANFSEYLKSLIPSRRVFVESDRQEYRLLANRLRRSLNGETIKAHILCVGPTGCGKSELAKSFMHEIQMPLLRVNLSDGITEDQFIGSRTLRDGEVVFQDGILTVAAKLGLPLLCDEINAARENILIALNGLMDTGMMVIPDDNNRVVKAKAGFMIIGTMNPPEDYAGVNEMNAATKNRFTYAIPFTYLPYELEKQVVMAQTGFTDEGLVGNLVDLANDLRRLKKEHQIETDTSTRMLVQLCDELQDLSLSEAVRYVMMGRYLPDEMATVEAAARARLEDFA